MVVAQQLLLLPVRASFLSWFSLSMLRCLGALAWWLFCNFGFSVGLCEIANVPPKALAC